MTDKLNEAIAAIKTGDKQTGRELLAEVIKKEPKNEIAWLWMTNVVDSKERKVQCLQRVLKINPNNQKAIQGLDLLQKKEEKGNEERKEKADFSKSLFSPSNWSFIHYGIAFFFLLVSACFLCGISSLILSAISEPTPTRIAEQNQPVNTPSPEVQVNTKELSEPTDTPQIPATEPQKMEPTPSKIPPDSVNEELSEQTQDLSRQVVAFNDIVRNPEDAGFTDAKFDDYREQVKGLSVNNWQGSVTDVKESTLSGYYVEVNMPGTGDEVDVFVYSDKDVALALRKGQIIEFSGLVKGLYPRVFKDWAVEVTEAVIRTSEQSPSVSDSSPTNPTTQEITEAIVNFSDIIRSPEDAGFTDAQFDTYKESLKGRFAENWRGAVLDVKQSDISGYYIEVNMPGTNDRVDVYVYTDKNTALSLAKGQQIKFSGVIEGLYPELFEDWSIEVKDARIQIIETAQ